MQRAPGEERLFRVPYGDGELEFMLQPWFDIDVVESTTGSPVAPDDVLRALDAVGQRLYLCPISKQYDIAIAGVGKPEDEDLARASRAAFYLRFAPTPVVREGGAIILAAQLDEGAGEDGGERRAVMLARTLEHCQVIVAASESPEVVRLAGMRAAVDVEEALDIAYEHIGRPQRASVLLVPHALRTLPVVTGPSPTR